MMLPIGMNTAVTAAAGALGVRLDPYGAYNFLVEIDGILSGGFSQVQGLESTIATEDKPEGGVNTFTRRVLGVASTPNLTLIKGLIDIDLLWTWFDQTRQGVIQRRNLTLMLLNNQRWPVMWWDFKNAIPVRWAGPQFDATQSSQVATETIELSHEGFQKPIANAIASEINTLASLG